ncbi:hypothetical protein FI667_g15427, partial [Globisporangium splendens]
MCTFHVASNFFFLLKRVGRVPLSPTSSAVQDQQRARSLLPAAAKSVRRRSRGTVQQPRHAIEHLSLTRSVYAQSALLTRTSPGSLLVQIGREIYKVYHRYGLESIRAPERSGMLSECTKPTSLWSIAQYKENFMRQIVDPDVLIGDLGSGLVGIEALLDQWRKYTLSYARLEFEVVRVESIMSAEENPIVVVYSEMHTRFRARLFRARSDRVVRDSGQFYRSSREICRNTRDGVGMMQHSAIAPDATIMDLKPVVHEGSSREEWNASEESTPSWKRVRAETVFSSDADITEQTKLRLQHLQRWVPSGEAAGWRFFKKRSENTNDSSAPRVRSSISGTKFHAVFFMRVALAHKYIRVCTASFRNPVYETQVNFLGKTNTPENRSESGTHTSGFLKISYRVVFSDRRRRNDQRKQLPCHSTRWKRPRSGILGQLGVFAFAALDHPARGKTHLCSYENSKNQAFYSVPSTDVERQQTKTLLVQVFVQQPMTKILSTMISFQSRESVDNGGLPVVQPSSIKCTQVIDAESSVRMGNEGQQIAVDSVGMAILSRRRHAAGWSCRIQYAKV